MASLQVALDGDLYPRTSAPHAKIRDWDAPGGEDAASWQPRAALPRLLPGQLWLVELPAFAATLSPQERALIAVANVVIYDRGLAPLVAGALPLGGYAEPAGFPDRPGDPEAAERCHHFVRDGWNVVRLIDGGRSGGGFEDRLRLFAGRLRAESDGCAAPVQVLVGNAGSYRETLFPLDRIGTIQPPSHHADRMVAVFPPLNASGAPALSAVAANGLAG